MKRENDLPDTCHLHDYEGSQLASSDKVTHNCRSRESTGDKIQRKLDCSSSLNAGIIKQQNESTYLSCLKSRSRLTITSGTDWWSGGGPRTQKRICILSHSGHEFTG